MLDWLTGRKRRSELLSTGEHRMRDSFLLEHPPIRRYEPLRLLGRNGGTVYRRRAIGHWRAGCSEGVQPRRSSQSMFVGKTRRLRTSIIRTFCES
jgi:hypothetical protein